MSQRVVKSMVIRELSLKVCQNQVIKFAAVPIFQKAEGTLPRRRLEYEVNFF